jgi:hypothetical protein
MRALSLTFHVLRFTCYTPLVMNEQDLVSQRTTIFLSGPAGTGKTTLAVRRLRALLDEGIPGDSIVVLAPQRSLLRPYQAEMERADLAPGTRPWMLTLGRLARQMVDLFWPAVSRAAGFAHPNEPPVFLTLETAQYYMARIVGPLMTEAGYLEGIHLQRPRLYSQILDNLNKAALVGFPYTEIGDRLKEAWGGEARRAIVFTQAQDAAIRFRQYCMQNNLLDFSLQVEVLTRHLLTADWFRDYLFGQYRHLMADNIEEEPPVTHDLLRDWLPRCDSALVVHDRDAGYRSFLGADPEDALALRDVCREYVELTQSHVTPPVLDALSEAMTRIIRRESPIRNLKSKIRNGLGYGGGKFHPQMLDWITDEIVRLTSEEGIALREIVVLAPFLSDSLRFALADRLSRRGIPTRSLRPSRALNDEPAARCLLTWAALAHPDWDIIPAPPDMAHALALSIDGLDEARAHLLVQRAYAAPQLRPFEGLKADLQDRIGFDVGQRYDRLHEWLENYRTGHTSPLDHFLSRLFGEVVSQLGFGFHRDLDAGRVAAGLIASARKFRQVVTKDEGGGMKDEKVGQAYIEMVQSGVIAATPDLSSFDLHPSSLQDAVLLSPAYTFLLNNQPVDVQFWINAGSPGWWERLYQPLTHPYVLTRRWERDRKWTDEDEQATRQLLLSRLTQGLIRRCRRKIYLAFSTLNEQGFEERGPLLMMAQQILRYQPSGE